MIDVRNITMEYSKEIDQILIEANEIIKHDNFVFNGIWDMEPCLIPYKNDKKWNKVYNNDPEWTYMFNRMDYLYKLVYAYEITGNILYLNYGISMINDWMKRHTKKGLIKKSYVFRKINYRSTRTLDTSIMIVNITDFLMYCNKIPNYNTKKYEMIENISGIIQYILDGDNEFKTKSNWGLIENLNILYCSNIVDIKIDKNRLYDRLQKQFETQFLNDGSHIESSPMYLVQIVLCILKSIEFSKDRFYSLLKCYLIKSLNYLIDIRTPDNNIPNFGDSDLTNISDVMILSSILLFDKIYLNYANKKLDLEFYYKYNINQLCTDLTYVEERMGIIELEQQMIITDKINDVYLLCNNTKRFSGHKHYDYLSFILYFNRNPFFIDCGRYTYVNENNREIYVGPSGHNTVIINNKHYQYLDSWCVDEKISKTYIKKDSYKSVEYIEMTVLFSDKSKIIRYFIYDDTVGLIIFDRCYSINNNYKAFFNLQKKCKIQFKEDYYEIYNDSDSIFFKSYRLKAKILKRNASNKYNEEFEINQFVFEGRVDSNIYLIQFEYKFKNNIKIFEELFDDYKKLLENYNIHNLCENVEKFKEGYEYEIYK